MEIADASGSPENTSDTPGSSMDQALLTPETPPPAQEEVAVPEWLRVAQTSTPEEIALAEDINPPAVPVEEILPDTESAPIVDAQSSAETAPKENDIQEYENDIAEKLLIVEESPEDVLLVKPDADSEDQNTPDNVITFGNA